MNARLGNTPSFDTFSSQTLTSADMLVWLCKKNIVDNIITNVKGHVLGAAMFHIKVGNQSVVYTGDYNMTPDRHLGKEKKEEKKKRGKKEKWVAIMT